MCRLLLWLYICAADVAMFDGCGEGMRMPESKPHSMIRGMEVGERVLVSCTGCPFYRYLLIVTAEEVFLGHAPGASLAPPRRVVRASRRPGLSSPSSRSEVARIQPEAVTEEQARLIWAICDVVGSTVDLSGLELAKSLTVVPRIAMRRRLALGLSVAATGLGGAAVSRATGVSKTTVSLAYRELPALLRESAWRDLAIWTARTVGFELPAGLLPTGMPEVVAPVTDAMLRMRIRGIWESVSRYMRVPIGSILDPTSSHVQQPRWVALALAYWALPPGTSWSRAGVLAGGVAHVTVKRAVDEIPRMVAADPRYAEVIRKVAIEHGIEVPSEYLR